MNLLGDLMNAYRNKRLLYFVPIAVKIDYKHRVYTNTHLFSSSSKIRLTKLK